MNYAALFNEEFLIVYLSTLGFYILGSIFSCMITFKYKKKTEKKIKVTELLWSLLLSWVWFSVIIELMKENQKEKDDEKQ